MSPTNANQLPDQPSTSRHAASFWPKMASDASDRPASAAGQLPHALRGTPPSSGPIEAKCPLK